MTSAGATRLHRRANRRRLSSPTRRVTRSILMPPSCNSASIASMRCGGCLQLGHRTGIVDLQRDDVRMVGDEADQVQLAEQAQHPGITRALAHQQPVHAVAHHQPQRLEQLGIGMDLDQVELRHLAHGQHGRRLVAQQRVAQVGGGEDAQARRAGTVVAHQGIVQPMRRQLAAHRDQVQRTVDIVRLAQTGVAHARGHQREHLALGFLSGGFRHGALLDEEEGLPAVCQQSPRRFS